MKKALCLILPVALLLLLTACGAGTVASSEAEDSENAASDETEENPGSDAAETEDDEGDLSEREQTLMDHLHRPVREYYICAAQYNTVYDRDMSATLYFTVLSVEAIDPNAIQVELDCQSETSVWATEADFSGYEMPYYLFCCYAGLDWNELAALYDPELERTGGTQSDAFIDYFNSCSTAYAEAEEQGLLEWPYHVYEVSVHIAIECDETVTSAVFTWPGVTETVALGEITLLDEYFSLMLNYPDGEAGYYETAGGYSGFFAGPLAEEVTTLSPITEGETAGDVKLTGFSLMEGRENGTEIVSLRLVLTNLEDEDDVTDMVWDGETPIYVDAGYRVEVYATLRNPLFAQLIQDGQLVFVLEYEYEGETCQSGTACGLYNRNGTSQYDALLAEYLDGVDVLSYYYDYYNLTCES
ncbi:MAG: hypothetical protein LUH16_03535 [Clostridiales bacterium]|nr:hypothetical protein [Clostridiales bacterium]